MPLIKQIIQTTYHKRDCEWEINTGCRDTMLICNNLQFTTSLWETEHCIYEIFENSHFPTIQPTRPHDDRPRIFIQSQSFSEILRHTIDPDRVALVCWEVSIFFFTIKNIVRGDRYELNTKYGCCLGKIANSQNIHIETCPHPDILSIINRSIGRTIQEDIWTMESDTLHDRFKRSDITLLSIDCNYVVFFTLSSNEIICEHTGTTRDEDFLF